MPRLVAISLCFMAISVCFMAVFDDVLASQEACTCDAVLNETAILNWTFPFSLTKDRLLVLVIQKEREKSLLNVIRLDQGGLVVSPAYTGRVGLINDGFADGVVTLKIELVHITDAGEYNCIVSMQLHGDWKMCHLKVRAPWSPVQKRNVSLSGEEYALSCESEGFPSAALNWTDEWGRDITDRAKITTQTTSGQLLHMTSRLNITLSSSSSSYTCTLTDDRGDSQAATFGFSGLKESRQHYVLVLCGVFVGVLVMFILKRLQARSRRD